MQVNYGDQSTDQLDIDFFGVTNSSPILNTTEFDGVLGIKGLFYEDGGTK